jgi:peptidoglycan hydrolase-like protein with peptidoglycan-binding domain
VKGFSVLASIGAHKRSSVFAAASAAVLAGVLALAPAPGRAANPGGTLAAGGAPARGTSAAEVTVNATTTGGSGPKASTAPKARTAPTLPRIATAACFPSARCASNPREVSVRGTLLLSGPGLRAGMIVLFPRSPGARVSRASPGSRLRQSSSGLLVTLPGGAHSGRILVLTDRVHHTGPYGPITVVGHALHPPRPLLAPRPVPTSTGPVSGTAFDGLGMWIWYVNRSDGGSVPAIVARAHAAGVTTVFIKSSDGSSNYWSQFSPQLVQELHANGLKVCGWQYVYGSNPAGEAALGAMAAANGADCLVIDAESEYEGRYAAAQTYIADLRAKVGPSYPVALASFPYVSYHPSEPYSVFLGPGGAQYNAPQMYWHDIGVSVDTVYANTYIANRMYGRPIFPLGQTYGGVSSADIVRFRAEASDYGATGLSFWDWQETGTSGWSALASPFAPLTSVIPNTTYPELGRGAKGDQVLWMQEHLATAVPTQETTGSFAAQTQANLAAFQTAHGIPASGVTDAATWAALLALPPVAVNWTGGGPHG